MPIRYGLYSFMYNGASLASVDYGQSGMEYLRNIPVNLQEVKPHILLSVPALAEKFPQEYRGGDQRERTFYRSVLSSGIEDCLYI